MSAIQIAQNTLGEKIPLSKEFFEKLTTKYPDLPSIEELMADEDLMVAAAKNLDGSIAVVVFNERETPKNFKLVHNDFSKNISISPQAIQTILVN